MRMPVDVVCLRQEVFTAVSLGSACFSSPLGSGFCGEEPIYLPIDPSFGDIEEPGYYGFLEAGPRGRLYFEPSTLTCAIATCGGLCPGLNNVIQSIVITAQTRYKVRSILGIRYGLRGCGFTETFRPLELTPHLVEDIHEQGGSILGMSRGPLSGKDIAAWLLHHGVQVLFMLGGDGTMKAAKGLHDYLAQNNIPVAVVGIPKTIDNDIHFVPRSFGFDTAVQQTAEAIRCAHTEAASTINGVGIVKVMGRDSGFIAAHASLSTNYADIVLIPEVSFSMEGREGLLEAVEARLREQAHVVVVVAEGAGQEYTVQGADRDASGNRALGDIGLFLRTAIAAHLRNRGLSYAIKYVDPGYMIRSLKANASDHLYCRLLGAGAVHSALAGYTGIVVANVMDHIVQIPLDLITRKRRQLHPEAQTWRAVQESLPFPFPAQKFPKPVSQEMC